jgi:hypothetical protein
MLSIVIIINLISGAQNSFSILVVSLSRAYAKTDLAKVL